MKQGILLGGFFVALGIAAVGFAASIGHPPRPHALGNIPTAEVSTTPRISVGGLSFTPELALTEAQREQGLSGRASVPDDFGMLFVYPKPSLYGFWMKNMLMPIDMIWLTAKGQVVTVRGSVATSTYPNVLYPSSPALYVLETHAGFALAHGIVPGTQLDLKNIPSVSE